MFKMIKADSNKTLDAFIKIIDSAYVCDIDPDDWLDIPSTDKWGINYDTHDKLAERWEEIKKQKF